MSRMSIGKFESWFYVLSPYQDNMSIHSRSKRRCFNRTYQMAWENSNERWPHDACDVQITQLYWISCKENMT